MATKPLTLIQSIKKLNNLLQQSFTKNTEREFWENYRVLGKLQRSLDCFKSNSTIIVLEMGEHINKVKVVEKREENKFVVY